MTNIIIKVKDVIKSEYAIDSHKGERLYFEISDRLDKGDSIALDFNGVSVFGATFFNHAIGQLFKNYSSATLNEQITIENLPPMWHQNLRLITTNAKRYYQSISILEN